MPHASQSGYTVCCGVVDENMPRSWLIVSSNRALAILNGKDIPVLVVEYQDPYTILVEGIFDTLVGPLLVDDKEGWRVLSESGFPATYTVKRVFVRSWFDIFFSRRNKNGTWGKPRNIGYPINTYRDETGLIVNARGDIAYFASDINTESGKDIFHAARGRNLF